MIDYQKNMHADGVVRELIGIEPSFLALFGVESLLQVDGAKKATINVLKVYIERRDHFARMEHIVEELFEAESLRGDLITKLKGKQSEEKLPNQDFMARGKTTKSSFGSSHKPGRLESNSSVSSFINSTKRNKNNTTQSDQGNVSSKEEVQD